MIDLHSHTTASDGTLTPTELVDLAKEIGLEAVAITDHDAVGGLAEAMAEGERIGIEVIPGIEINTKYEGRNVHMVGLYIDKDSAAVDEMSRKIISIRHARNHKIYEKLRELGVDISEADFSSDPLHVVTRGEIGRKMVEKGFCDSVQEAFYLYLEKGGPAYIPRQSMTPKEACDIIHGAGGVAIVAHLYQIGDFDLEDSERICRIILDEGADGLETRYSKFTPRIQELAEKIADEYGCLRSGGSDFHGSTKPDISLGTGGGNLSVPYEYLSAIKKRLGRE